MFRRKTVTCLWNHLYRLDTSDGRAMKWQIRFSFCQISHEAPLGNLKEYVLNKRCRIGEIVTFLSQVASALHYLHVNHIVHGDLNAEHVSVAAPDKVGTWHYSNDLVVVIIYFIFHIINNIYQAKLWGHENGNDTENTSQRTSRIGSILKQYTMFWKCSPKWDKKRPKIKRCPKFSPAKFFASSVLLEKNSIF